MNTIYSMFGCDCISSMQPFLCINLPYLDYCEMEMQINLKKIWEGRLAKTSATCTTVSMYENGMKIIVYWVVKMEQTHLKYVGIYPTINY